MSQLSEAILTILSQSPFVQENLSQGLINYSALARMMQPKLKTRVGENVTEAAIIMALKRLEKVLIKPAHQSPKNYLQDIILRSNLVILRYKNSDTLQVKQQLLLTLTQARHNTYIVIHRGTLSTTILLNSEVAQEAESIFTGELLQEKVVDLAALTLTPVHANTQINYYLIFKQLASQDIVISDVFTNYNELILVIDSQQVAQAYAILKK